MPWPSKDPGDYAPEPKAMPSALLRYAAWALVAIAVVLLAIAAVKGFFGPMAHDPADVDHSERVARRYLIAAGVVFGLSLVVAVWSEIQHGRER